MLARYLDSLDEHLAEPIRDRITAVEAKTPLDIEDEFTRLTGVLRSRRDADRAQVTREWVRANHAFHDVIYAAAGNRRLLHAWHALRSQVYLFQLARIRLGDEDYRSRLITEHWQLATLLRDKDLKTLAKVAEDHVDSARRALVARLAQSAVVSER